MVGSAENTMDCIYWGIFLEQYQIPEPSLSKPIEYPHVTFAFKRPFPQKLLGMACTVKYIGYGDDGCNQALAVELPEWAYAYYQQDAPPHITISVAENAKPVDSGRLLFEPIGGTCETEEVGIFGFFGFDHCVHLR